MAKQPINDPNGPQAQKPMVTYGQQGLKTGVAKADQARNQPGAIAGGQLPPGQTPPIVTGQTVPGTVPPGPGDPASPTNFLQLLKPNQQARVQQLLGDSYDPSKPLNMQLFQARWEQMNAGERKTWADTQRTNGNWLLEGAKMNTVHDVRDAYVEMLHRTNQGKQELFQGALDTLGGGGVGRFGQPLSGNAMSPAEVEAQRAGLQATMAANPNFATPEQVASFESSWAAAEKQYNQGVRLSEHVQRLAAHLGVTPDKIVPPDLNERLARAKLGYDMHGNPLPNIPSASDVARWPGLAAAYANMPHLTAEEARNAWQAAGSPRGPGGPGAAEGGMGQGANQGSAQSQTNTAYGDSVSLMPWQPAFSESQIEADYI